MQLFAGDNDYGNHEFQSIIMLVAMALAASICVWRTWLIMKSAIFRAVQPVWGKRIYVLWLYAFRQLVRYKCLSKPHRAAM